MRSKDNPMFLWLCLSTLLYPHCHCLGLGQNYCSTSLAVPFLVSQAHRSSQLCHQPFIASFCLQLSQHPISQSVQSLSCVQLFATPWTASHQASLSITNYQSLLKLMSIESVMPSSHLILCRPFSSHLQSFPASGSLQMSQFFASGGQSIGVLASTSVPSMNVQDWFPLGWTGWISLQS